MLNLLRDAAESIVLKELAGWLNKAGKIFGDPMEGFSDPVMYDKYLQVVGKLNADGCKFVIVLAKMVEFALRGIQEAQKEQDERGVN